MRVGVLSKQATNVDVNIRGVTWTLLGQILKSEIGELVLDLQMFSIKSPASSSIEKRNTSCCFAESFRCFFCLGTWIQRYKI